MKKIRVGLLCFAIWFLLPRDSGAEEFLYLPITRAPVITAGFCGYRTASGACHGGIDYDVRDDGDGIFAAAEGVVEAVTDGMGNTRRDNIVSYGNSVRVRHPNGYLTIYAHFKSGTLEVGVGDEVRAGELLGTGDNSGWSTGSHLHFEVRDASGHKVDPYGESPSYPNCGTNRLWVNCPPTVWVDEDSDGDTWTVAEGDCDDANAAIYPGAAELCNGADEDCDGETDETWPELDSACTVRLTPYCDRIGTWICEPFHRGTACGADYTIYPESCNHLDDDCDGETDETWPLLGVACEGGFGECRASGVWECEPIIGGSICSARPSASTPELCDNLDNDCDRETDEDWPELGTVCGIFPCDGTYVCSLGGSGSYCNSDPGMPETCDGLDNDCDGETDETPAGLACADASDCTEDVCLFGLCQNVSRDRDGDTYADDLCGGSDCNDLNPAVWEYTFSESRLTTSVGDSNAPVLVWTGAELGVAWEDWRAGSPNAEIYFARADASLARIGDEVRVTNAPWGSNGSSLAWTGTEYGLAWYDFRSWCDIYFARLDTAGLKIGSDIPLTDHTSITGSSREPSITWTGSEFGIVFRDSRLSPQDLFFFRLNPDGTLITPEAPIVSDSGTENFPILVWTGAQYGLAYTVSIDGYQQILFVRTDSSGGRIGGATSVAAFDSLGRFYAETADLVWQGSEFALVWTKNMASGAREVYFRKIDAAGTPVAPEVLVATSLDIIYRVALTWNGREYGVTWQESSGMLANAYFVRLDQDGGVLGSEVELSASQRISEKVAVVWTGHEYVFAWSDSRDGDWEIYLGRIGCGW
jgi:hypothetical protein